MSTKFKFNDGQKVRSILPGHPWEGLISGSSPRLGNDHQPSYTLSTYGGGTTPTSRILWWREEWLEAVPEPKYKLGDTLYCRLAGKSGKVIRIDTSGKVPGYILKGCGDELFMEQMLRRTLQEDLTLQMEYLSEAIKLKKLDNAAIFSHEISRLCREILSDKERDRETF